MIDVIEKTEENLLSTKISGKITEEDYKQMYPLFEETISRYGKIKLYVELEDFEGWQNLSTLWDEVKMDTKYYNNFQKVAIVGEKKWEEMLTKTADVINPGDIRFFANEDKEKAREWLYQ